jgi:hypothetical protein
MRVMRRRQSLTPVSAVLLVLVIAAAAWVRWQGQGPAATPGPPSAPATSASTPPPPTAANSYDLDRDERLGGHTLARHVGRSDIELRDRLRREPGISAASTYTDRTTAERVIATTLSRERRKVDAWLARQGTRPNLALDYRGTSDEVIGRSIRRGGTPRPCANAVVVLRSARDGGFMVLTSYPEAR